MGFFVDGNVFGNFDQWFRMGVSGALVKPQWLLR